jgi:predicted dehydrogenase
MRILFCGLGGIGQRHLRCVREILGSGLEAHAYRVRGQTTRLRDDLTVDPQGNLEKDYGLVVHSSLEAALAASPDAAFICNPSSMHIDIAIAVARAGVHVFIEKPLSSSLDNVEPLRRVVEATSVICCVGYNFRFHPALIRLKRVVEQGVLGNIVSVSSTIGEYLPAWHPYEDYRMMYAARSDLGGGVILSQIHEFDLIYWLFGLPTSIYSRGGKLSDLEIDVEDVATSLMWFDGSSGTFPLVLQQDFVRRPAERTFNVIGNRGSARVDLRSNEITISQGNGDLVEQLTFPSFKRNDMFLAQARHFFDCIDGSSKPTVGLDAGIQSLRMALAAKQSLKSQREVEFHEGR